MPVTGWVQLPVERIRQQLRTSRWGEFPSRSTAIVTGRDLNSDESVTLNNEQMDNAPISNPTGWDSVGNDYSIVSSWETWSGSPTDAVLVERWFDSRVSFHIHDFTLADAIESPAAASQAYWDFVAANPGATNVFVEWEGFTDPMGFSGAKPYPVGTSTNRTLEVTAGLVNIQTWSTGEIEPHAVGEGIFTWWEVFLTAITPNTTIAPSGYEFLRDHALDFDYRGSPSGAGAAWQETPGNAGWSDRLEEFGAGLSFNDVNAPAPSGDTDWHQTNARIGPVTGSSVIGQDATARFWVDGLFEGRDRAGEEKGWELRNQDVIGSDTEWSGYTRGFPIIAGPQFATEYLRPHPAGTSGDTRIDPFLPGDDYVLNFHVTSAYLEADFTPPRYRITYDGPPVVGVIDGGLEGERVRFT